MSNEDKITALEGLLDRVRRRASEPRSAPAPVVAARPSPSAPEVSVEGVGVDDIDDLLASPAVAPEDSPRSQMETSVSDVEEIEDLDMEDDLVEIDQDEPVTVAPTHVIEAAPPAGMDVDIDFDDEPAEEEEEEPPASSRRAKAGTEAVAESMDEALAHAAEADDREVPLQTPPPESGQQVAAPAIPQQARTLDAEEFDISRHAKSSVETAPRESMPTMEQLGETVELEGADAPDAELELAAPPEPRPRRADDLEAPILSGPPPATYDASLAPPPEAREELERHRDRDRREATPADAPPSTRTAPTSGGPEVTARPAVSGEPADFAVRTEDAPTGTFLEALDASLSLLSK